MKMDNIDDVIILTGAGFSKNFGGFLGIEMWSEIFNEINNPKTKHHFLNRGDEAKDFNFENIYSEIIKSNNFSDNQKEELKEAIYAVYRRMDFNIMERLEDSSFCDLDNMYSDKKKDKLLFTLNQDLLLERKKKLFIGWAGLHPNDELKDQHSLPNECPEIIIPEDSEIFEQRIKGQTGLIYLKLHGSYKWKRKDGDNNMILGINKEEDIKKEPILNWYFNIFREAIAQKNKKLLIIGYSFQDKHINKIIYEGIDKYDLRLYILNTQSPQDLKNFFKKDLSKQFKEIQEEYQSPKVGASPGLFLWYAIDGYFQYKLSESGKSSALMGRVKSSLMNK